MDNTNAFNWNVWLDIMKCNIDIQDGSFYRKYLNIFQRLRLGIVFGGHFLSI